MVKHVFEKFKKPNRTTVQFLILLLLLNTSAFAAEHEKVVVNEIKCGKLTMTITTIFTQNGTGGLRNFKGQTATVTSYGKSRSFILDLDRSKIDYGERDFGLAYEYKCIEGTMGKKYLQLLLSVGGSCRICEWVDLVDENGKRIASSRGDEDERRYFSFIKKLGISKKEYSKNWMLIGVWD